MFGIWVYTLASVTIVSLLSFIGLVFISLDDQKLKQVIFIMVSFAVGGLLGDAFIHLLPEALERSTGRLATSLFVLAGILAFFTLEKFLHWQHGHSVEADEPASNHIHPMGYTNLIADGIHNSIDGMLIGASYLVSIRVGLATTTAVILHEIPHEIGNFGVLLHAGFSKGKALFFNFLSATLAVLGAVIALSIGSHAEQFSNAILPFAAGGFIYIAGSDLVPELHKEGNPAKSFMQLVMIVLGIVLMLSFAD